MFLVFGMDITSHVDHSLDQHSPIFHCRVHQRRVASNLKRSGTVVQTITYVLCFEISLTLSLIPESGCLDPPSSKALLSKAFKADSQAVQSPFWAKTKIRIALALGGWGVEVFLLSFLSPPPPLPLPPPPPLSWLPVPPPSWLLLSLFPSVSDGLPYKY